MYLWKCWLDTRIKIFSFVGLFLCLQLAILFGKSGFLTSTPELQNTFLTILIAVSSILLFIGWVLGNESVGADVGRGLGDFLLTRPGSRGSFVWTGWMVGIVESIVLWIFFFAVLAGDVLLLASRRGSSSEIVLSSWLSFCKSDLPILFLMFVINVGLVYGLTYCIGVIARSGSRALVGAAALIFGYQILRSILLYRFHLSLPALLLPYPAPLHAFQVPALHSFLIRGLIAVGLPAVSHLVLERAEI